MEIIIFHSVNESEYSENIMSRKCRNLLSITLINVAWIESKTKSMFAVNLLKMFTALDFLISILTHFKCFIAENIDLQRKEKEEKYRLREKHVNQVGENSIYHENSCLKG